MCNLQEKMLAEINDISLWIRKTGDGLLDINVEIKKNNLIKLITSWDSRLLSKNLSVFLITELNLEEDNSWNIANPLAMFDIIERKLHIDEFLASK